MHTLPLCSEIPIGRPHRQADVQQGDTPNTPMKTTNEREKLNLPHLVIVKIGLL